MTRALERVGDCPIATVGEVLLARGLARIPHREAATWRQLSRGVHRFVHAAHRLLVEEPAEQISAAHLGQLSLAHDRRTAGAPVVEAGVLGMDDARCNA